MKLEELNKLIEAGHGGAWSVELGDEEDLNYAWWVWDKSQPRNHFMICRGESNQWAGKLIAASRSLLPKLIAVAEAAKAYRDKVEYTGGDSTMHFAPEQDALDEALTSLESP